MYGTYEELSAGDHNDLDEFLGLLTHESETSHEFSYEEEAVEGIGESVQEECAECMNNILHHCKLQVHTL